MSVIDRIAPDEADLPPSQRTWARIIRQETGFPVLEMRDPNSGQDPDPESKPRFQYLVMRDRLWTRHLPPAPLGQPDDESRWQGEADVRAWALYRVASGPGRLSPIVEWAMEEGLTLEGLYAPRTPQLVRAERNPHATGYEEHDLYIMPPADPFDMWADITSYGDRPPVTCPVDGCGQHLMWYEAGYVPGYRVCMAPIGDGRYDRDSLRHRFTLDHSNEFRGSSVLIRSRQYDDD